MDLGWGQHQGQQEVEQSWARTCHKNIKLFTSLTCNIKRSASRASEGAPGVTPLKSAGDKEVSRMGTSLQNWEVPEQGDRHAQSN